MCRPGIWGEKGRGQAVGDQGMQTLAGPQIFVFFSLPTATLLLFPLPLLFFFGPSLVCVFSSECLSPGFLAGLLSVAAITC